jgi:hypothetical protein
VEWSEARPRLEAPIFAPLRGAIAALPASRWPTHEALDALAAGITTASGRPLRFVPPRDRRDADRRGYELRIHETGEVETREANWHDLFNALAWVTFPRAKATINAQHAAILLERGEAEARRRGPERDALTLFDEGGIAVACDDPRVRELVVAHEWKRLFWTERDALLASARFFAFGHALLEKALEPYLGIVAKAVFIPGDADTASADERLAAHFRDRTNFRSARALPPVPVFGIPGWHPRTGDGAFYDDAAYFRPRRPA